MHRSLLRAFADKPFLLSELKVLERELQDIEQDDFPLEFHSGKKCVAHRFNQNWEMEYVILQHWSDHIGATFSLTEEPDKKGFYNAYITI